MKRVSRRKFIGSSAALPLGLTAGSVASAQDVGRASTGLASLIVTGANVYTMIPDNPKAEAVAIRGSRILAVGSNDDIVVDPSQA